MKTVKTHILAIGLVFSFSMFGTTLNVNAEMSTGEWIRWNDKVQDTGKSWEEVIGAEAEKYHAIERQQYQDLLDTREKILKERENLKVEHMSKERNLKLESSLSGEQQNAIKKRLKNLDLR